LDLAAVALPALRVLRLIASLARVAALARRGLAERVMVTTTLVAVTVVIGAASTVLDAERNAPDGNITPTSPTRCGGRPPRSPRWATGTAFR
jgi:voltage-gated potassium channel